jgi:hypothetical protein
MVIELKITNLSDWAIIQPLLQRLKIAFVQKDSEHISVAEESVFLYKKTEITTPLTEKVPIQPHIVMEDAVIWSPYDAYEAAEILLKTKPRRAGFSKARFVMSDDFNAPLDDFNEYML